MIEADRQLFLVKRGQAKGGKLFLIKSKLDLYSANIKQFAQHTKTEQYVDDEIDTFMPKMSNIIYCNLHIIMKYN